MRILERTMMAHVFRRISDSRPQQEPPRCKVLLLGRSENESTIPSRLQKAGCEVWHTSVQAESYADFDFVVSYDYHHILRQSQLDTCKRPIINLHSGYLPYNRGHHPCFWAIYDGTPSGVTIHHVSTPIHQGDILFQKYVNFDQGEQTFAQAHERLQRELEDLFSLHLSEIIDNTQVGRAQRGRGTYHRAGDLPASFAGWSSSISEEIERLDRESFNKLEIIDAIESVRQHNNVNWMDLLRLAFSIAPNEAKDIVKRIDADDRQVSSLLKKLLD